MDALQIFVPLSKVDEAQRLVYGTLTQETPDKSREIFHYETGKEAFVKWSDEIKKNSQGKSLGNVRAMHGKTAAGKMQDIFYDDENKTIQGCAKVVDDNEWQKVLEGVYTGFSIGGSYAKRWADKDDPTLKWYTPVLAEVSLVDNPCVPTATFEVIKEDGAVEMRKFVTAEKAADTEVVETPAVVEAEKVEEAAKAVPSVVQGWLAQGDDSFHLTKAAAIKHNALLEAQALAAPVADALGKAEEALQAKEPEQAAETVQEAPLATEKVAETVEDTPAMEVAQTDEAVKAKADAMEKQAAKVKELAKAELKKGMYEVARAACLIEELQWLQSSIQFEAEIEQDGSAAPQALSDIISTLCAFLRDLVAEETAELAGEDVVVIEMAAKLSDLHKSVLAPLVKGDALLAALTITPAVEKTDVADELEKAQALNEALKQQISSLGESFTSKADAMIKRIEHLEAQPLPPKGVVKVVTKDHEGSASGADVNPVEDLLKRGGRVSPDDMTKAVQAWAARQPKN